MINTTFNTADFTGKRREPEGQLKQHKIRAEKNARPWLHCPSHVSKKALLFRFSIGLCMPINRNHKKKKVHPNVTASKETSLCRPNHRFIRLNMTKNTPTEILATV